MEEVKPARSGEGAPPVGSPLVADMHDATGPAVADMHMAGSRQSSWQFARSSVVGLESSTFRSLRVSGAYELSFRFACFSRSICQGLVVGALNELARHANGRTAQSQRNRHSLRRELVGMKGDANARM